MFKRSGANYSLWPEQRPRRGKPLKFAIGSFVLGAVCATAYGTLFNFTGPATGQGLTAQRVVEPIPIVIAREVPDESIVPVPPPKPAEIASRPGGPRATAKVTLPLIGTPSPLPPAATDGRGNDGLSGEVRLTGPDSTAEDLSGLLGGDNEPSPEPVRGGPAKKAASTAGPKAAEPTAVVPVPSAAPPKTVAVKESAPLISRAPDQPETARPPEVTLAPAAKTEQATTTEPRTESHPTRRGVIVVAKREESTKILAGGDDDDAPARAPAAQGKTSKPKQPAKTIATRTERRGVVVLTKREEPTRNLAGGDDEVPARKPAAQAKKAKPATTTATETPAKRRGYVVLKKKREQPVRAARGDDGSARKTAVRTPKAKKVRTASVGSRRAETVRSVARKKPERSKRYAARSRSERKTTRQARPRQDRLSSMIAQATRAYRAFTAGQAITLQSGF